MFLTGLMAGSYPALFLSSLQPGSTLKGRWLFPAAAAGAIGAALLTVGFQTVRAARADPVQALKYE